MMMCRKLSILFVALASALNDQQSFWFEVKSWYCYTIGASNALIDCDHSQDIQIPFKKGIEQDVKHELKLAKTSFCESDAMKGANTSVRCARNISARNATLSALDSAAKDVNESERSSKADGVPARGVSAREGVTQSRSGGGVGAA